MPRVDKPGALRRQSDPPEHRQNALMAYSYVCAGCGGVFIMGDGWTDADVHAESADLFVGSSGMVPVCDDCHKALLASHERPGQWTCVECEAAFTLSWSTPHMVNDLPMCPDCWRTMFAQAEAEWRARGGLTHTERADRGLPDLRYRSV